MTENEIPDGLRMVPCRVVVPHALFDEVAAFVAWQSDGRQGVKPDISPEGRKVLSAAVAAWAMSESARVLTATVRVSVWCALSPHLPGDEHPAAVRVI